MFRSIRLKSFVLLSLVAVSWPVGCDRSALRFPPPTHYTLDNSELGGDPVDAEGTESPLQETGAGIAEIRTEETTTPENEASYLVATGGVSSDVRTTRTILKGPLSPPSAEEFKRIADSLVATLGTDGPLPEDAYIYAEEAPVARVIRNVTRPVRTASPLPQPIATPAESEKSPEEDHGPSVVVMAEEVLDEEYPSVEELKEKGGMASIHVVGEQEGSYRLGSGDTIDVTVWGMPELSRALVIRPDGYISFPLIREIKAAGKTPAQLERILEERLSEDLIEPEVSVVVTSFSSKVYYVFGAVAAPGPQPYIRDTTLLQAIISVGGFGSLSRFGSPAPYGDLSRIRIIRQREDGKEIITKNLKDLSREECLKEDIPIQPGDIIYIPEEENLVFVFGEVRLPGVIPIGTESRVLEAVLAAGGVLPTAKEEQVLLIRPGEEKTAFWCLNLKAVERGSVAHNMRLKNGDIVFVPQKFIAKVAEFVQLYTSALQPAMETYLTSWDAWFVHERFSALRRNEFGVTSFRNFNQGGVVVPNPDR